MSYARAKSQTNKRMTYVYERLSSFLVKTFWMQSTQFESSAAVKPMTWNELSERLQNTRPVTIGSSDAFTRQPVRCPSSKYVKMTVKNGADDLIVSAVHADDRQRHTVRTWSRW